MLLNPLDARSPRWSPFYEARSPRDFDTMAAALIPQQKDTVDPFWVTAARQLFANGAGVLRERGIKENRVLVDHLLKTDLTALAEAMEGTVAQSILDPENPKTALSVRAMLTANIAALEYLPDTGAPFSIRDWVSDEERGGFLFLTSRGDQHASLRELISTWLEIAVNAMLSLEQDDTRRIWVVVDEVRRHRQDQDAEAREGARGEERLPHDGPRAVGLGGETLQLFLARNAGVAEGRLSKKGERDMRSRFAKTVLVVDEGSLASTVQARDLLRIANVLRIPRVVLVGEAVKEDPGQAAEANMEKVQTPAREGERAPDKVPELKRIDYDLGL